MLQLFYLEKKLCHIRKEIKNTHFLLTNKILRLILTRLNLIRLINQFAFNYDNVFYFFLSMIKLQN